MQLQTYPAVLVYPALMSTPLRKLERVECPMCCYPAAKPPRQESVQSPSIKLTLPCCIRRQSATALALPCCDLHSQSHVHSQPHHRPRVNPACHPPLSPSLPGPPSPSPSPAPGPILSACTHSLCLCPCPHLPSNTPHWPSSSAPTSPFNPVDVDLTLPPLHVQTSSHVLRPVLTRPNVCK